MSDVLSGDVAESPEEAGADDLRFHWMNRQASLVPSPKLYHYLTFPFSIRDFLTGEPPPRGREAIFGGSHSFQALLPKLLLFFNDPFFIFLPVNIFTSSLR